MELMQYFRLCYLLAAW